jgi:ribonuclease M5
MKPYLYVVEGQHDVAKLRMIDSEIETWVTYGNQFNDERLSQLLKLSESYEIVLLLDPDGAGERIRKRLIAKLPEVQQIFIPRDKALSPQGKIGIEHVDIKTLKEYLKNKKVANVSRETWTIADLFELNLMGNKQASLIRQKLSDRLGLPYANGKSFCRILNQFNISKKQVLEQVKHELKS